jgi:hypothetical protein
MCGGRELNRAKLGLEQEFDAGPPGKGVPTVSTAQRNSGPKRDVRRGVLSRDDRLIWLSIAAVAGVDGGILAGLLTAVAGGTKAAALAAGGAAALGTFGAVLTIVRFLHDSAEK